MGGEMHVAIDLGSFSSPSVTDNVGSPSVTSSPSVTDKVGRPSVTSSPSVTVNVGSPSVTSSPSAPVNVGSPSVTSNPSVTDNVGGPSVTRSPSITDNVGSPSVTNFVLELGEGHQDVQPTPSNVAFSIVVGLLSVNYNNNGNGNLMPANLFTGRPMLYGFFLMVVMVTFFVDVIAVIIWPVSAAAAKVLKIVAFICVVLGFTVLLWALLPPSFSWVPWIFFGATISVSLGVIVYKWLQYVKKVKAKSAEQSANTSETQTKALKPL